MAELNGHGFWSIATGLGRRPDLWVTALRQAFRLARPRWWWHWPPLPFPDPDYLRFRVQTAYGDADRSLDAADLVAYVAWCHRMQSLAR